MENARIKKREWGSLAVRSAPTGSAAARQHTAAMRFSLPVATRAAQPPAPSPG